MSRVGTPDLLEAIAARDGAALREPEEVIVHSRTASSERVAGPLHPRARAMRGSWRHRLPLLLVALLALGVMGLLLCSCSGSSDDAGTVAQTTAVTGTGTSGPTGSTTSQPATTATTDDGVVELPMKAPTVIDVATKVAATAVVTPGGAVVQYGPVKVEVPSGAVATDTTITITRVIEPFHTVPPDAEPVDGVQAELVSGIYDFGPAGVSFAKPVTVTLPYDSGLGADVIAPERVAMAYWNGEQWMVAGGVVDPVAETVTVQIKAFEGIAFTIIAGAAVLGFVANRAVAWYYGPEGVKDDKVSDGVAGDWVTPDDAEVQKQMTRAVIQHPATKETKPLNDPGLADWVESIAKDGNIPTIAYKSPDGKVINTQYDKGPDSNWQKPSRFFTTGTPVRTGPDGTPIGGPMAGDCTDLTNASVSVFTAAGFPAKGVVGYGGGGTDQNQAHAWGEVVIGNRVYRIDVGGLLSSDNNAWHYDEYKPITDPKDPRFQSMWDKDGQKPYAADWWAPFVKFEVNGRWTGTMIWKSMNLSEEAKQQALNQGCDANFFKELMDKPLPLTLDVDVDKAGKGTATLTVDVTSLQKYNKNIKSSPETYECTLVGDTLAIKLRDAGTMACKLSQQGKDLTLVGALVYSAEGSSMTIEIKAVKQQ